jgi:hypothetical protein
LTGAGCKGRFCIGMITRIAMPPFASKR